MSDQGFHEVQLSGKQLVFLFMSAVVVMVVVFLLGVNVGRGVRSAVGDTEVLAQSEPVAAASGAGDTTSAPTTQAKPSQPELSYHDMLLAATPAADKGGAEKTAPPEAAPRPVDEAPPPVNETPASQQNQKPAPNPSVESKPAVTQSAPVQAPPPGPKPRGADWFLQTGAYSTQAVADGQVAKLKALSFPAFVLPLEKSGKKLFHVRVGPFGDRAEAERVSSRLSRQGFPSSITR